MAECIHKNGIYSIAQNAMEFANFWMNKRRSVTELELLYELVYVNIKTQKVGLNMNPALSVSLSKYELWRRSFVYNTYFSTRELEVIFGLSLTHELTDCESHFMRILPFNLRKLASYHTVYQPSSNLAHSCRV